ncbi:hypothetical protein [Helicobacter sp. MIT 14-3879]|uniref:hypothetical protein n=1 Tax=Helicobacter sp. MIT 14-3879 TaxID=2040649 RepID=UPI000E1E5F7B|nr:hypothetical protein [Helicobacter sp. MIT 14-3879]RDU59295.1 hypothetical protein CQA44_11560 [Helicobacter sp. MIT 14-3879]
MVKNSIISLALSMFLWYSFAFGVDIRKEKQDMREYGLAYCLANFHQTEPSNDIIASLSIYFENMVAGYDDYNKLIEYIKQYMGNHPAYVKPSEDNPRPNEPVYFYSCLKMYDSKEYQDEVERIVKKYCKDCK